MLLNSEIWTENEKSNNWRNVKSSTTKLINVAYYFYALYASISKTSFFLQH